MADVERLRRAFIAADEAGNEEDARYFAEQLRKAQREAQPKTVADYASGAFDALTHGAQQFNTGIVDLIPMPQGARDWIADTTGVTTTDEPGGAVDQGLRLAGESLALAGGGAAALGGRAAMGGQQFLNRIATQPGTRGALERSGQQIVDTARRNPLAFGSIEASGGFGAGAGMHGAREAAESAGMSDEDARSLELLGLLGGGMAASMAPGAAATGAKATASKGIEMLLPMTERGARPRAARELQGKARNPAQAAEDAVAAPEGVTPARATGDPGLMAYEQRVLHDKPQLRAQVEDDLARAEARTAESARGAFGEPAAPGAWEHGVMERVAAPGARVEPGDTDVMLNQAYESFGPAYAKARGHTVDATEMRRGIDDAIGDPKPFVGENMRTSVRNWVNSQLENMRKTRMDAEGQITSDDLLDLRHAVRERSRALANATDADDRQARELFDNIDRELTSVLEGALPEGAQDALRATDAKYRQYKVVEDAVYRVGEGALTPEAMSKAIQRNTQSRGHLARGGDQELRQLALSGRGVESVLGRPDVAERMVRGLSEEQRQPVKADFARTLYRQSSVPDEDGIATLSGRRLRAALDENAETAKALGLTEAEMGRLRGIADQLVTIQRQAPGTGQGKVVDDELNALVELGGRLAGATAGGRAARATSGGASGPQLVLAWFMSRQAVRKLKSLTAGKTEQLLTDAVTDPELYHALMTGPTSALERKRKAGAQLNAWLLANVPDRAEDAVDELVPSGPADALLNPWEVSGAGAGRGGPQDARDRSEPVRLDPINVRGNLQGLLDSQGPSGPDRLRSLLA